MTDFLLISTCFVMGVYVDQNASKSMAEKIYNERGANRQINEYIDARIDEGLKVKLGNVIFATKTFNDKKIVYEYHF